ncbi:MAG: hypothetical protein AAGC67_06025 [Myxococcota bacterium]
MRVVHAVTVMALGMLFPATQTLAHPGHASELGDAHIHIGTGELAAFLVAGAAAALLGRIAVKRLAARASSR